MPPDPVVITPFQQIICSFSGAVLTSLTTTPFDVVRVRLQAQQQASLSPKDPHYNLARFSGTRDAFFKIAQLEGFRSWWKGLSPTLLMTVPATAVHYSGYDYLKALFGFREGQRSYLIPAIAGAIARTVAVVAVCPIELIKTKLQSRRGYDYRELLLVIRNVYHQNGLFGLWRGLCPMLFRDVTFASAYWVGYEWTKLTLSQTAISNHSATVIFMSGIVSGTVCTVITSPLDVVKTHMQVRLGKYQLSLNYIFYR
jgi:solute carrier family 25 protein 39/40